MHMQMEYVQELPTPEKLKRRFPVSSAIEAIKEKPNLLQTCPLKTLLYRLKFSNCCKYL